MKVLKC